jgi:hypothetical protein
MTSASQDYVSDVKMKNFHDLMHCDGKYSKHNALNAMLEFPDMAQGELAQNAAMDAADAAHDPLGDLFS